MTEYILSIDTTNFLYLAFLALIIQFLVYKESVFSILDPLSIYLINNSFSIAFVIYLFMDSEIRNEAYVISFFACNAAFAMGIKTGAKKNRKLEVLQPFFEQKEINESIRTSKILYVLLCLIVIIVIIANVFLILQTGGLPLLSSDPDSAKVLMRQDGLGLVYRVNNILLPLGVTIIMFKIFPPIPIPTSNLFPSNRFVLISLLIILILFSISGGSKSAVISFVGIFLPCQIISQHFKSAYTIILNQIIFSLVPIGILLACYVFIKNFNTAQYLDPLQGWVVRLVANGDAFYYFYKYDLMKKFDLNVFNYIVDTLNPLSSLLKITPYDTAIGEKILIESINLTTGGFGPNGPYPIYGLMYFGFLGSCVFSFIVGYTTSFVRVKGLTWVLKNPSELNMVVYTICFYNITSLPADYISFVATLFSSLIFILPVVIISKIFTIDSLLISILNKK